MANATPRDTRAGFDVYRSAGGDVRLEDLNAALYEAGYGPVSNRTFAHYRHLLNAGYDRYISINRFDVARAAAPFESQSASPRYSFQDVDLGVSVIFAKGSRLHETYGRAVEMGEVGAILRFTEPEVIDGLRLLKPQPGDMVTVRYLEPGRTVGGRVVEADTKASPATVEIEYTRLVSISALGEGTALPTTEAGFRLLLNPDAAEEVQTLDMVSRRIYHFFELIEGLRALSNEAGSLQAAAVYAEPSVLRRLTVASDPEVILQLAEQVIRLIPYAAAAGLMKAASLFVEKRKEWYEGTGQKTANALTDLEVQLKQLEVDRSTEEVAFIREVQERVRATFPTSTVSNDEIARMVTQQIIKPLQALGQSGVTGLSSDEHDGPGDQDPGDPQQ